MPTYNEILQKIETLKKEAEATRKKEAEDVIARIKAAIAAYGFTAEDLGFGRRGKQQRVSAKGKSAAAKYGDDAGNTWSGRGPRPKWLRDALSKGRRLEDFLV